MTNDRSKSPPMQSQRQDNRGHWPAGKPRNPPPPPDLIAGMIDLYQAERASLRYMAAKIGVSDRTLRRWLAGEDHPHVSMYRRIEALLRSFPAA